MEVNAHAFTGSPTQQGYKQEMMVQVVELISVGRLPSKAEIMTYNAQQTWGPVLSSLFNCNVIIDKASKVLPNHTEDTIQFRLPTDCNWHCFVDIHVVGCNDGYIMCSMTESQLTKQLECDFDLTHCGI